MAMLESRASPSGVVQCIWPVFASTAQRCDPSLMKTYPLYVAGALGRVTPARFCDQSEAPVFASNAQRCDPSLMKTKPKKETNALGRVTPARFCDQSEAPVLASKAFSWSE